MNQSPLVRGFRRFSKDRKALVASTVVGLIAMIAILAQYLSPFDPQFQNGAAITLAPSSQHWMGTDSLGRDLLSRIFFGSRITMAVAITTALSAILLGSIYGSIAGFFGGTIDMVAMRVIDFFYTIPTLLLMLLLTALIGEGLVGILFALSLEGMLTVARLVRAEVLRLKESDFVLAARALGSPVRWIFLRHLLPNLAGPIIVTLTFLIPANIMYEAFLSFIGLGIQPPMSSWGTLANEGWRALQSHPNLILFPGLMIFLTMLAFNLLGDGLRDAFDSKTGMTTLKS